MAAPVSVRKDQLTRLVALSPGDGRITALVRRVCAQALSLPPLPAEVDGGRTRVRRRGRRSPSSPSSSASTSRRSPASSGRGCGGAWGTSTFGVVVAIFIADFVPRVRAGLEALGVGAEYLGWTQGPISWDHATDPSDVVFNDFLPAVARLRALDPVTTELVRLRGAAAAQLPAVQVAAREHRARCRRLGVAVRRHRAVRDLEAARRARKSGAAVCRCADLDAVRTSTPTLSPGCARTSPRPRPSSSRLT